MNHRTSPTIGVFTAELNDFYQALVWKGISARAESEGLGLICFLGSRLDSPITPEKSENHVYDLAGERNIDGLIVVTSAISTYQEIDSLCRFFESRPPLPMVSIGLKIPGVPNIMAEGRAAFASLLRHMIEDHHCRRFALITGPTSHAESSQREAVFYQTLCDAGLEFLEPLRYEGTFEKVSGALAVRQFLDSGESFDAVVCFNDKMAFGALDELKAHGIAVPDDVRLTGFDGIQTGECSIPPLTTVFQPLEELGEQAVDTILGLLGRESGRKIEDLVLECRPMIRDSCGCRQSVMPDEKELSQLNREWTPEDRQLEDVLLDLAMDGKINQFLVQLDQSVSRSLSGGNTIRRYRALVLGVQNKILEQTEYPGTADSGKSVLELFTRAYALLGEINHRYEASKHVRSVDTASLVRSTAISISEEIEIPVVLERLFAGLDSLGFDGAYLVLYEQEDHPHTWSKLYTTSGIDPGSGDTGKSRKQGIRFRTESILPPGYRARLQERHWVLLPLVFQYESLGFLLLPAHVVDPEHYLTISKQLASTLKGRRLLDQVRRHEQILEQEVARRTDDLVKANRQLTREIKRRSRLEKEVSDVSNMVLERIGQDLHDDLCQHLAGISMMVSAFESSSDPATQTGHFAAKIRKLLSDSIDLAKGIARSLAPVGLKEEGLAVAIEVLVESLKQRFPARIYYHFDPDININSLERSTHLYRIVQEALTNAVKHAHCSRIDVRLAFERQVIDSSGSLPPDSARRVIMEVVDNGIGFPMEQSQRGMGLRTMRYRAELVDADLSITNIEPSGTGTKVSCTFSQLEQISI